MTKRKLIMGGPMAMGVVVEEHTNGRISIYTGRPSDAPYSQDGDYEALTALAKKLKKYARKQIKARPLPAPQKEH